MGLLYSFFGLVTAKQIASGIFSSYPLIILEALKLSQVGGFNNLIISRLVI